MTEPSLALQKLVRSRLIASADLTALVVAASIVDRNEPPSIFPSVLIGEGQTLYDDRYETFHQQAFLDLHVWTKEPGTAQAKEIVWAIRNALVAPPWSLDGFVCHQIAIQHARFLRDPDHKLAHAVVGISAIMQELVA